MKKLLRKQELPGDGLTGKVSRKGRLSYIQVFKCKRQ